MSSRRRPSSQPSCCGTSALSTEGGIKIDILFLVDRLEELFNNGTHVPLTRRVLVDEQAFLDIIDQMRIAIPEEIRQAKRVVEERNRLLGQAQEEAERTLSAAQEHAAFLLNERGLTQEAEVRAQAILAEARSQASKLKTDADNYCMSVLGALETELTSILQTTRNGMQHLQSSESEAAARDERGDQPSFT